MNKKILLCAAFLSIIITIAFLSILFIRANKSHKQRIEPWHEYIEEEHNAKIYLQHAEESIKIIACLSIAGIDCSIHLNHACTEEQFSGVQNIILQNKGMYKGITETPDTEGYPNLTDYLPLVMSSDEMHQMWVQLNLED
ncbi:MAG: hypothetical protein K6G00_03595 [Treponema sp.]|nr:hypothetical protein [Treponema sp.]